MRNEVISTIGKIYVSIYRIDLMRDSLEELSSTDEAHTLTGNTGIASQRIKEFIAEMIQEDCEPQKLAEQLSQYLGDDESAVKSRSVLIQRFTELHKLIQCDADSQAAQAVIDLLEQKHD